LRVVGERAAEWHVDRKKLGIMGFSAGGYVAVTVALDKDRTSSARFIPAALRPPGHSSVIHLLIDTNRPSLCVGPSREDLLG
jgi:dienelactone hydrolase